MSFLTSLYHTTKFWLVITILSIVLGSAAIVAGLFDRSGDSSHRIGSLWGRWLCNLNGIGVAVQGLEHIDRSRAQIFIANHQSFFDIFALSGFLPVQMRWVAKSSLFNIPFLGWAMKSAGYVSVDRGDRKKAYQAFMNTIEKLKEGASVVIFPEGTRSEDGTIGPFKKGSHLLAVRSQAPMVPVTILGSGSIIKKGSGVIRPHPIRIFLAPPILLDQNPDAREEDILNQIRDTIRQTYEENLETRSEPK